MRETYGVNISADKDETGAFISVDWTCPHCDFYNSDLFFTSRTKELTSYIYAIRNCQYCDKEVKVICNGISYDGLKID